jgi:hypothetical protein
MLDIWDYEDEMYGCREREVVFWGWRLGKMSILGILE